MGLRLLPPPAVSSHDLFVPFEILEECSFVYPDLFEVFSYWVNTSEFSIPFNYSHWIDDCSNFYTTHRACQFYLNVIIIVVLVVGLLMNIGVILILGLDKNKTSADVYLISIALGDVTICIGTAVSSQVMRMLSSLLVAVIGQVIGNTGISSVFSKERDIEWIEKG